MGRHRRLSREEALAFPSLAAERKRALTRFGIDFEESFRAWMVSMGLTELDVAELVDRETRSHLFSHGKPQGKGSDDDQLVLTQRQRECIAYMACGYNRTETGEYMHISMETVKSHLDHARFRLRATSTAHLVVLAAMIGEIDYGVIQEHLLRTWEAAA